jgi:aminomethyltransferase
MTEDLKRTPLADIHRALGAKMVPFAGWEMPVQYSGGIMAEHQAVRNGVGIFDVSHMGEFEVTGPDRNAFVNRVTCNDVSALEPGGVQYSGILSREGTFVDDCTVYRFDDRLMMVVNASNRAKAWEHIVDQKQAGGANIRLRDISDDTGLLAVQGPHTEEMLQPLASTRLSGIGYYKCTTGKLAGIGCFISRTGYTGEDGFEIYCRWKDTVALWEAFTKVGAVPIGLGARDSLRLEMGYALYGQEIDDTITPLEAGLSWIVKLDKGAPFMGLEALRAQKERGVTRRTVGFRLQGRGIARHGYPVWYDGKQVDLVRSGGQSPSLGYPIGTTMLPAGATKAGTKFEVECRGERIAAEVVKRPFWEKGSVKKGA